MNDWFAGIQNLLSSFCPEQRSSFSRLKSICPTWLLICLSGSFNDFSLHFLRIFTPSFFTGDVYLFVFQTAKITSMLLTTICRVPTPKITQKCVVNKGIKSILSHLLQNVSINPCFPTPNFFLLLNSKLHSRTLHIHYPSFPYCTSTAQPPKHHNLASIPNTLLKLLFLRALQSHW